MRLIILLACLTILRHAQGQDTLTVDMLVPDKAIKFSPLHLINFYPTVELSYEQKIIGRYTAQLEAGYVVDYNENYSSDFENKRGAKLKLEVRNYFWGRTDRRKLYYIAIEGYMNIINFDRREWRRECFDLECTNLFMHEYTYMMKYREHGFTIKAGVLRYAFKSDFFVDINSGFTLRVVRYHSSANFVGEFLGDANIFFDIPNETDRVTIGPNLGFRFAYRL